MSKNKQNLEVKNARKSEQIAIMQQAIKDGVCPFCSEYLAKYHKEPILFKTSNWIVTKNAWPYNTTKNHFLIIAKEHIDHSSKISPAGWQEIGQIIKKLEKEFNLEYGTLLMRFGEMSKTGATVRHLHFQLVQSDPKHPEYDPSKGLWTRIG